MQALKGLLFFGENGWFRANIIVAKVALDCQL